MKQMNLRRFPALLCIAVTSLFLSSCAELLEAVATLPTATEPQTQPQTVPQTQSVTEVPSLRALAPAGMYVGVAVPAGKAPNSLLTSPERQLIVTRHFNQITAENIMKPLFMQRNENRIFFADTDALVNFAASNGMTVHGHTLVWHYGLPAWMNDYKGDAAAWRALMVNQITKIVSRYAEADVVVSWDVVNEAVSDVDADKDGFNDMRDSVWQKNIGASYIAEAYRAAYAADPNADLYYNDYNIEGVPEKLNTVLRMVRRFKEDPNPVPLHGIAFQMHIWQNWPDLNRIRRSFALVAETGLKVKITELDIAINSERSRKPMQLRAYDDATAIRHRRRFREVIATYMEVVPEAQRGGISVWGIADVDTWWRTYNAQEWPLLFDDNFEPKPALLGFAEGLTAGRQNRTQ